MKVLVTGGGGFIGIHLIRKLVQLGYEVSTFSRRKYSEHKKLGIKVFQGDLTDVDKLDVAVSGVESVFHVAAKAGIWGSYDDFYRTNVMGTENVINSCIRHGVKNLVFSSSASVVFSGKNLVNADESVEYPANPISNYTATKALAEQMVLKANCAELRTIALRPHLVWGPGDTQLIPGILKRASSGRLRKIGNGNYLIDTTYIDNATDAHIMALKALEGNKETNGKCYFISNDEAIEAWTFLNSIIELAGYKPVRKRISRNFALSIAWFLEMIHTFFQLKSEPYITQLAVLQLCSHHWFNISAARKEIGYSPKVSLEEGMKLLSENLALKVKD